MNNYTSKVNVQTQTHFSDSRSDLWIIVYKGNSLENAVKAIENYRKWNNDPVSTSEIVTEQGKSFPFNKDDKVIVDLESYRKWYEENVKQHFGFKSNMGYVFNDMYDENLVPVQDENSSYGGSIPIQFVKHRK